MKLPTYGEIRRTHATLEAALADTCGRLDRARSVETRRYWREMGTTIRKAIASEARRTREVARRAAKVAAAQRKRAEARSPAGRARFAELKTRSISKEVELRNKVARKIAIELAEAREAAPTVLDAFIAHTEAENAWWAGYRTVVDGVLVANAERPTSEVAPLVEAALAVYHAEHPRVPSQLDALETAHEFGAKFVHVLAYAFNVFACRVAVPIWNLIDYDLSPYPLGLHNGGLVAGLRDVALRAYKHEHKRARGERLWVFASAGKMVRQVSRAAHCRLCGEVLIKQAQLGLDYTTTPDVQQHTTRCALEYLCGIRTPVAPGAQETQHPGNFDEEQENAQ